MLKTNLSLSYLEYSPQTPQTSSLPLLIFLHGKGANENDLFDLAPELEGQFQVLSVRAPVKLGLSAFGWFHSEYPSTGPVHSRTEVEKSFNLLVKFIDETQTLYQVQKNQIYLCGFSQGAMMSLGIALQHSELVGGIAALSGRILPEHIPQAPYSAGLNDFPILLSHGTQDEVLSVEYARSAKNILSRLPVDLRYFEYSMGHDVTPESFEDVKKWLFSQISHSPF